MSGLRETDEAVMVTVWYSRDDWWYADWLSDPAYIENNSSVDRIVEIPDSAVAVSFILKQRGEVFSFIF